MKQEENLGQNGDSTNSDASEALRVPMTSSPSLSPPSSISMVSPPTQSLTAESSQAKVAFMGAIGLWRVPEEEKQGKKTAYAVMSKS